MTLKIFEDNSTIAHFAANQILDCVRHKPDAVLCLTSGDTPRETYHRIVELAHQTNTDFSRVTFFALDEWLGIPTTSPGSCFYIVMENLLKPLKIDPKQFHYFDGLAKDPQLVCDSIHKKLQQLGGLDLIFVGVGLNGHVGLNEPGTLKHLHAHISDLDQMTIDIGQKYFTEKTVLTKGLTMGLADFLEAKVAMVIASGKKKAPIMKQALEGAVSNLLPVSLIREHKNGFVVLDAEAASELTKKPY
jgi:glucosamine-6-phosphate isomerase